MPSDGCDRCGNDFLVTLVAVAPPDDRDRMEAELCYSCRQDVTCERLA